MLELLPLGFRQKKGSRRLIFSQNNKFCVFLYFLKVRFRFRMRFRIWQGIHGCSLGLIVTTLLGIEILLALFKVSMTYATFSLMLSLLAIFSSSL